MSLDATVREIGQDALDAAFDPFYVLEPRYGTDGAIEDLVFRYVNAAGLRLYRLEEWQVLGRGLLELFPSTRELGYFQRYCDAATSGTPAQFEIPFFSEGGIVGRSFDIAVAPCPGGIVVCARDVTERNRMEGEVERAIRAAREADVLLDTLQENAPVGFAFVNREFRILRSNQMMAAISGVPVESQVGLFVREVIPEYWPVLEPLYEQALAGESVVNLRMDGPTGDVPGRSGLMSLYPVQVGGAIVGVGVVVVDISEQLAADAARARSDEWSRALIQNSSDVVIVVGADGTLLYGSPSFQRVLGYDPADWVGRSAFDLVHPDDAEMATAALLSTASTPEVQPPALYRVIAADGTSHWIESTGSNLLDNPAVGGVVVNARDVTAQHAAQAQLARNVDAMVQTVSAVAEARDPYTAGHQRRVADLAVRIAQHLDLPEDEIAGIRVAATIHDVGKIAVPTEILVRPGQLSALEMGLVETHAQVGHDIVATVEFPWPVARMILEHHERMDGSGYPNGTAGADLLLGSRIIAVADTVEAMSSHRPYRPSLGIDAALAQVTADRGTLFDPLVVDACLEVVRDPDYQPPE